jgi:D-alanyl-D-alanine carboxypeptidase/D-alanyl-D-alanine-endopeptidase (penicillin-binding protein 4)
VGGQTRFATVVRREPGSEPRIVIVGGGDPLLSVAAPTNPDEYPARATLTDLAASTAQALLAQGIHQVGLDYDASLFSGPAVGPGWLGPDVASGVVAPISALSVDEGLGPHRSSDPAAAAAAAFAAQLASHGVTVSGPLLAAVAPSGSTEVAQVQSVPLVQIIERTLERSDNFAAEVVARQVGLKVGGDGSFDGAAKAVRATLQKLGVNLTGATLFDGSGLSRNDRVTASTVAQVLRLDVARPELNGVFTGLPIAGFTGTLVGRFDQSKSALGLVHAKTGTLSNDHGLAGVVPDATGTPFVFVVIADNVGPSDGLAARNTLDQIAAAIATCTCSKPSTH